MVLNRGSQSPQGDLLKSALNLGVEVMLALILSAFWFVAFSKLLGIDAQCRLVQYFQYFITKIN